MLHIVIFDAKVRQSSSTISSFSLLSYFSPLYFPIILLFYFSFFCDFLVHIQYNLFALLGRKALFTHSQEDFIKAFSYL